MSDELTIDKVIAQYLKLRRQKEAIESEVKEQVASLRDKMAKMESWLKVKADEAGVKSFKTDAGTAFLTTTDFASVADWDEALKFIQENEAWDMLVKGVNKTAVRGYIEANKAVPNGVTFGSNISINIRKPAPKD